MALKSPTVVILDSAVSEDPDRGLGDLMNEIRSWLDGRKIRPIEFKTLSRETGGVILEIKFRTEDEAYLFEQAFA